MGCEVTAASPESGDAAGVGLWALLTVSLLTEAQTERTAWLVWGHLGKVPSVAAYHGLT